MSRSTSNGMKKIKFIVLNVLSIAVILSCTGFAFPAVADTLAGSQGNPPPAPPTANLNFSLNNPLKGTVNTLPDFLIAIIKIIIMIATPIAILAIIYCGFLFVTAHGNAEKLTKAKSALLYTVIGVMILLGAQVIAIAIQSTIVNISK